MINTNCSEIVGARATTTRDNTLASGSRFALVASRFAAVLDASSPHDAILQRVREFFAHAMHE